MSNLPVTAKPRPFLPADLVRLVAHWAGASVEDVCGGVRKRHLVRARAIVCVLLRQRMVKGRPMSYPQIGQFLKLDRTTVQHHVVNYQRKYADDRIAREIYELAKSEYFREYR